MNIALIIFLILGFFILLSRFFTVKQQSSVIVERLVNFTA
jgi:regulator of protease activity HflC (stomatin/prohibitin superfamily)